MTLPVVDRELEPHTATEELRVETRLDLRLTLGLEVRVAERRQCRARYDLPIHYRLRELLLRQRIHGTRLHARCPVGGPEPKARHARDSRPPRPLAHHPGEARLGIHCVAE